MDISVFGLGTVAAITVLCYLAGTGVKTTPLDNKYIPVICGGTGLVLGLVALYAGMPGTAACPRTGLQGPAQGQCRRR